VSRFTKSDALACPIFINELNSGGFEGAPDRCFISGCNRDLSVDYLDPSIFQPALGFLTWMLTWGSALEPQSNILKNSIYFFTLGVALGGGTLMDRQQIIAGLCSSGAAWLEPTEYD
jgi:hypothetical protein